MFGASSKEKSHINLNIGNTVLQQVEFSKYLWVYIDSDLSWQHHIDFIYNKMLSYRRETALQGALWFSPKVEDWNWETIFYGQYRSIFNYCDIIGRKICRIP